MDDTQTTKQVVQRYHDEMWVKKNLAALDELVHPEFSDDSGRDFGPPGPAGAKIFFQMLFKAIPDLKSDQKMLIAEGNHATIMWVLTGTYNGESLWGMPVTGKSFSVRGIDLLEVKDGKLYKDWGGLQDQMPKIMQQLGLTPPQS